MKPTSLLTFFIAVSFTLLTPLALSAMPKKVCIKEDGSVVLRKRCKANKGLTQLNLSSIANTVQGAQGPKGEKGDTGEKGATGDEGPLTTTLPSALTLRGDFYALATASGANQLAIDSHSFGFEFTEAPTAHYLKALSQPTTECPGSPQQPEAAPGHLCVYENGSFAPGDVGITSGIGPAAQNAAREASKFGFTVYARSQAPGTFFVRGSWAATTP